LPPPVLVGPLLHVPETPCFECIRLSAQALADQQLDPESVEAATAELNHGWQAPSYGPLNALVAAIQAKEGRFAGCSRLGWQQSADDY
jgi:hypothetical protein